LNVSLSIVCPSIADSNITSLLFQVTQKNSIGAKRANRRSASFSPASEREQPKFHYAEIRARRNSRISTQRLDRFSLLLMRYGKRFCQRARITIGDTY
jgi:hypothetical protein